METNLKSSEIGTNKGNAEGADKKTQNTQSVLNQTFTELQKECEGFGGATVWARQLQRIYFAFVDTLARNDASMLEAYTEELFTLQIIIERLQISEPEPEPESENLALLKEQISRQNEQIKIYLDILNKHNLNN